MMIEIGLVIYPGAQLAAVLGLTDLFGVANRIAVSCRKTDAPAVRVTHWRQDNTSDAPHCVFDSCPEEPSGNLSALIVPPTLGEPISTKEAAALTTWLRDHHADGVALGSVCAGAFALAATGLIDGRRITTHWSYADMLQQRFPALSVDADQLIIDDGDIITAGGLMAWTDLGLRLVDRFLGPTVMIETARVLLVDPPGREQRYYSVFSPRLTHGDAAVLKVQHWLQATQAADVALKTLAAQAGLQERTFLRRFQKATGMTTTEYCQRLRVGRARELLQFSNTSIDRVAWEVGYSDPGAFRKVFARIVGLSPGDYRRRFSVGQGAGK
ncbi:GlxA family transcriptional regulator [Advenella mimigardefordensis]|uniref:Transcriptional regulator, AraC family n=1 Tax=Advenella mimigardefordensis (strain DSM 17166 / LMG 22922 / DPN7) TaxID=1247726 RepID=W0PBU5_ADVMD|nr:GlxA family transcriptional regulator [Advenella mimigardefordensis]AHG62523.1 transcriptional regulator, AraC family [Advenella mimigardefordensis DPN7]